MEDAYASGMIHMFLSDPASRAGGWYDMAPEPSVEAPSKRLLLACFGAGLVLSGTARNMAVRLGRNNARTTILNIPDAGGSGRPGNPADYDGIFIGISPDGSGHTERAFSFIRNYFDVLSAKPVALFYLLPRVSEPEDTRHDLAVALSGLCPLDIRSFDRSCPDIPARAADWALNTAWPLMETGWLADLVFPEPIAGPQISPEHPRAAEPLY